MKLTWMHIECPHRSINDSPEIFEQLRQLTWGSIFAIICLILDKPRVTSALYSFIVSSNFVYCSLISFSCFLFKTAIYASTSSAYFCFFSFCSNISSICDSNSEIYCLSFFISSTSTTPLSDLMCCIFS